jgi:hypothetical protein
MQSNVIQQRVSIHGECPKIEGLLCFFHERVAIFTLTMRKYLNRKRSGRGS